MIWCSLLQGVCVAGQQKRIEDIVWFENSQRQDQNQDKGQGQEKGQEQDPDFMENVARIIWMDSGEQEEKEEKVYIRLK